uniref:Uncharacterized protein n=1 Tax=Timema genevievae TaxID=629358 RepID=A0A7R9JN71_TIMGE|nr:unnamed protein product [Timema genevievae]
MYRVKLSHETFPVSPFNPKVHDIGEEGGCGEMDMDDIEKIVSEIEKEEKKRNTVVECIVPPPSRRANFSLTPHKDKEELILFGGEYFNGQKVGAPAHYDDAVRHHLDNRLLSQAMDCMQWVLPARSPNLTLCDVWLWGHMKGIVYSQQYNKREHMSNAIVAAGNMICDMPYIFQ